MSVAGAPSGILRRAGTEVRFCRIDDDRDIPLDRARGWLSAPEADRADRFRFPRDRDRFVRGRGFLRRELAERLGCDPGAVRLDEGAAGKPFLIGGGPRFNLSHSGGLAALALCDDRDVGLDIEVEGRDVGGIGGTGSMIDLCFCAPEAAAIRAAPDPEACFLRFWTAKEARMKLTGEGMRLEPRSIVLAHRDGRVTGYLRPAVPPAELWVFERHGAVGAVATALGPV